MIQKLFEPGLILAILPQIGLLALAVIVLAVDLPLKEKQRRNLGWLTAAGLLLTGVATLIYSRPGDQPALIFGGMLRQDWLSFVFHAGLPFWSRYHSLVCYGQRDHRPAG